MDTPRPFLMAHGDLGTICIVLILERAIGKKGLLELGTIGIKTDRPEYRPQLFGVPRQNDLALARRLVGPAQYPGEGDNRLGLRGVTSLVYEHLQLRTTMMLGWVGHRRL